MLSGALVAFIAWASEWSKKSGKGSELPATVLAGFAACSLTKRASNIAFSKHKRSTTTPDIF
jgi:NAD(P)H-hydrate repair Nnr-like enzyme with NAD(P)H-hydrate dehydratase domain